MADDIAEVARRWGDATGEMMVDAIRDWNRDIDCPGIDIPHEVSEMARSLVYWCDGSGRPIDPTPITECMRFAHQSRQCTRAGDSAGAKAAFDSFGDSWSKCVAVLQRIQHAAAADDGEFVGPYEPSQWADRFDISVNTFGRWRKDKVIRSRDKGKRRVWVHKDDVAAREKKTAANAS